MAFFKTSLIRKSTFFLAAALLSVSATALDSNQIQRLANQGDAEAQFNLGWMYYQGEGVRQDYAKAFEWYKKVANQGDSNAQFVLGLLYYKGEGVRQDYAKAAQWFLKVANQGDSDAQAMLGVMYNKGKGVRQNVAIAKEWFGKSCDNGLQAGCDSYRKLNQR